jgi:hypothetical protein
MNFHFLPPDPNHCPQCAAAHETDEPHDATSLFYGFWFMQTYGRPPTWADAMQHCSEEVKAAWIEELSAPR